MDISKVSSVQLENEPIAVFVGGALWATMVIAVATLPEWMQWCIEIGKSL